MIVYVAAFVVIELNIAVIAGIINHDLQLLSNWAKQWLVTFNPLKTDPKLSSLLLKN